MKVKEKEQAIHLRQEGKPIKVIAAELGVAVSSVSNWVKDIILTDEQHIWLNQGCKRGGYRSGTKLRESAKLLRKTYQDLGRQKARENDFLHAAGCMLYWAEGDKSRNSLGFTNSDPGMLVYFKRFLDKCFCLNATNYVIRCAFYTDKHSQEEIESYWLQILSLPKTCLRASTVNYYNGKNDRYCSDKRKGLLEYGTCHLGVYNTQIVQHIFGAIQEYSGIDNDIWLN